MITIFSHVGLDVTCEEDLVDLFQHYNHQRKISLKIHEDSLYGYAVVSVDDHIEYWSHYCVGTSIANGCLCYCDQACSKIKLSEWVSRNQNGLAGKRRIWNVGEEEFLLTVDVANAAMIDDLPDETLCECQITAFPYELSVYRDVREFHEHHPKLSHQCMIAGECLCNEGKSESPIKDTALISGVVRQAEIRTNDYSQNQYQYILLECYGMLFHVVVDLSYMEKPVFPGNIVLGVFDFTARFEVETTVINLDEDDDDDWDNESEDEFDEPEEVL